MQECLNMVIVGHVDHGKSTVIGRLLADTNSLPQGKLEQIKSYCKNNSKPFEYAFLLDALKDEQAQGITIDIARCFFKTKKRKYIILDAPGHIEFLKNMITGAANAQAALLVIDANEGIQENSKRHAYMLAMLGIKQLVVLVNKMDLINYDETKFNQIISEYTNFLNKVNLKPIAYLPISAAKGDVIATLSDKMPWYKDKTVLQIIDEFEIAKPLLDKPFRMPVQDIYKFTKDNDARRIIAGRIESGQIKVGDKVIFYPSGKTSHIAAIENYNNTAGFCTGFTLTEQIYIKRGEIAAKASETKPESASRLQVSLFWLGKKPLTTGKDYYFKLGTAKIKMQIEQILQILNASNLETTKNIIVKRHEVAECILKLHLPIAFDLPENNPLTSRFVIIDDYNIAGGGIIKQKLEDETSWIQDAIQARNINWITSDISREERAKKYHQDSGLIIITGKLNSGRKELARALEKELFNINKQVYYLGIGNVVYGIDADIHGTKNESKIEHIRRFAEVINIMLDAGQIVIVTAAELTQTELDLLRNATSCKPLTIWLGKEKTTDINADLHFFNNPKQKIPQIITALEKKNV